MATKIDLTAAQFTSCQQFETADGKVITVNDYCVEEREPVVSLKGLEPGDRFRVREGQVFLYSGERGEESGDYYGVGPQNRLYFHESGHCNLRQPELEVVEVIRGTLIERIEVALGGLPKRIRERVNGIRVSFTDWYSLDRSRCGGSILYIDGLRVLYGRGYEEGEFALVFKARED